MLDFLSATSSSHSPRLGVRTLATSLALVALAALSACGGDGGSSGAGTPTATVSSVSVNATEYGSSALVTINGTGLDSSLAVTSAACTNMTLLTASPTASSSTTAYYSCTVDGALTSTVIAKSNGTQVGSASFTVPAPIVTMAVQNGQGVNGNLVITLAPDKAPLTVDNFLKYVHAGFYDGTIFHRVVPGFIMQAGGYASPVTNVSTATLKTGTYTPIAVEKTGLSNVTWSIAMANAGGTATTTSQFYFNLANNTGLDGNYAVFGAISAGTDVAQTIVAAPASCVANSAAGTTDCLPIPNVIITTAKQTQ